LNIDLANESEFEIDSDRLSDLFTYLINSLGIHPNAELSVIFVDEEHMTKLHVQWMDEPGATDVLSFPMDEVSPDTYSGNVNDEAPILGDLVLCPAFAQHQAEDAGQSLGEELELLSTHGMLHLLGYDHAEEDEERTMFALQNALLAEWRAL
jgi:probable rRNA maturation factor